MKRSATFFVKVAWLFKSKHVHITQTNIYILQYYILVFVPFCMYVQTCISFFALLLYYLITISRPTRIFFFMDSSCYQIVNSVFDAFAFFSQNTILFLIVSCIFLAYSLNIDAQFCNSRNICFIVDFNKLFYDTLIFGHRANHIFLPKYQ